MLKLNKTEQNITKPYAVYVRCTQTLKAWNREK
jgi:hypothetical protein